MKTLIAAAALAFLTTLQAQDLSHIPRADQQEAVRLFKIYRGSTDWAAREQAADALTKLDVPAMLALMPLLEQDWQTALTSYRTALQRAATDVGRRKATNPGFNNEVRTLQGTLARLRSGKGLPTKEQLHGEGLTALNRLRELHNIAMSDLVKAQPTLGPLGDAARAFTRMRTALKLKTRLKNDTSFTEEDLAREETAAPARAFQTNPAFARVLEANAALAARKEVPADEAEGVRDLNEMRMLLGLPPCLLDPKLANAAREHSKDMATKNFFAHESPVPGKKTPWDRAKLAGTSASAENIAMGMKSPTEANMGWFFSPGHHVNMFGNHLRVGLGQHGVHWTQLFGN